ncbi:response regulator transcription factor [Paroceanicella profunda]|uniref:Response regulator transcription factor n=2 Tax=Paroceanicella profunda TaxID=2579971 RepID=A0A5B8G414_9RHOB|nr:response regulator transcription factor [Paroceanicella profunda]
MNVRSLVHIVDDDPSMRYAIAAVLRSVDIRSAAYDSCQAFLAADVDDVPGCLLLDVRLPGVSGLDFQTSMQGHGIRLPVIMITAHADVPMSVRAMKAGAVDFLPKPFRDQDLLDAVGIAIDRDIRRRSADDQLGKVKACYETLSTREKQVMGLVTSGKLNKQAAHELGLSEITVKLYRASAMKKMGARSLADFVRMAERLDIRPQA